MDTELTWHRHTLPNGSLLPSRNLVIDSSGALHSVSCNIADLVQGCDGTFNLTHQISYDGGYTWINQTHRWPLTHLSVSDNTFEWDFQADGNLDLAVITMRVQI